VGWTKDSPDRREVQLFCEDVDIIKLSHKSSSYGSYEMDQLGSYSVQWTHTDTGALFGIDLKIGFKVKSFKPLTQAQAQQLH